VDIPGYASLPEVCNRWVNPGMLASLRGVTGGIPGYTSLPEEYNRGIPGNTSLPEVCNSGIYPGMLASPCV